jgi:hypothetical protein
MRELIVVASIEAFSMALLPLLVEESTVSPALREALPTASVVVSVPDPAEGEESYKLDLHEVPMTLVARIQHLEVTAM